MRDISARVRLVDGRGRGMIVPELLLRRRTDILEKFPLVSSDRDGIEEVHVSGDLDDWIKEEGRFVEAKKTVLFPHREFSAQVPDNSSLVDEWCRILNDRSCSDSDAWDEYPGAMAAAEKLVRLTGLVVSYEMDVESISQVL